MTCEELRALLLQFLKAARKDNAGHDWQFRACVSGLESMLTELKVTRGCGEPECTLCEKDRVRLKQVVWDLILERVLIPGTASPESNAGWPFISLTEHGIRVVDESRPTPYDPDGYLSRLKKDSPGLHQTAIRYIEESLSTFRSGNYLASVVMLGAASEKIFVELCDAITTSISDKNEQTRFAKKVNSKRMKDRLSAVIDWCRNHKTQLCGEWTREEGIEVIEHIADFIRKRRNEAGHPNDPPAVPAHEKMYSYLMVFPEYCKNLCELTVWLDGNKGKI